MSGISTHFLSIDHRRPIDRLTERKKGTYKNHQDCLLGSSVAVVAEDGQQKNCVRDKDVQGRANRSGSPHIHTERERQRRDRHKKVAVVRVIQSGRVSTQRPIVNIPFFLVPETISFVKLELTTKSISKEKDKI